MRYECPLTTSWGLGVVLAHHEVDSERDQYAFRPVGDVTRRVNIPTLGNLDVYHAVAFGVRQLAR